MCKLESQPFSNMHLTNHYAGRIISVAVRDVHGYAYVRERFPSKFTYKVIDIPDNPVSPSTLMRIGGQLILFLLQNTIFIRDVVEYVHPLRPNLLYVLTPKASKEQQSGCSTRYSKAGRSSYIVPVCPVPPISSLTEITINLHCVHRYSRNRFFDTRSYCVPDGGLRP